MLECSVAQKKQRPASKAGSQKRKAWRWCRSDCDSNQWKDASKCQRQQVPDTQT